MGKNQKRTLPPRIGAARFKRRSVLDYLRSVWANQREARRRLVTPIYHAEASAQAEALATAAAGSQARKSQQGKRSRGGLGHELPFSSFVCIDGIYTADVYIFKA